MIIDLNQFNTEEFQVLEIHPGTGYVNNIPTTFSKVKRLSDGLVISCGHYAAIVVKYNYNQYHSLPKIWKKNDGSFWTTLVNYKKPFSDREKFLEVNLLDIERFVKEKLFPDFKVEKPIYFEDGRGY